MRVATEEFFVM